MQRPKADQCQSLQNICCLCVRPVSFLSVYKTCCCVVLFYSSSFYCRVSSVIGAFPMRYLIIMYPAYLIYRDFDYWFHFGGLMIILVSEKTTRFSI